MFDAIKARLARRSALKRVRGRAVKPRSKSLETRHVLVVLPSGDDSAREAWRFVKSLGLPKSRLTPVVLSGEVTYAPAEYVSRIVRLDDAQVNAVGLPKDEFLNRVWAFEPDVAFCLSPRFDIASACLVGASPASFRVGFYDDEAEPFFDLMIAPPPSGGGTLVSTFAALKDTLARIEPPVLALDAPSG